MVFFSGFLVHEEGAVNFYLKAVAAPGGPGVAADEFDALIWVVYGYAEALAFQMIADCMDKFAAAGGAVAVAEDKITGRGFVAGQFGGVFGR